MTIKGFARSAGVVASALPTAQPQTMDVSQRLVVDLPSAASAAVIGAPGTGKTTTIVELVANRVLERGWAPNDLVVLGPTRTAATRLRDRLALRLAVPTEGPLARTVNSLAFEVVAHARKLAGQAPPRLLTGPDQDSDISQLLAGHIDDGTGPRWPEPLGPDVRRLRGFRTELRELMMRATEYDLSPAKLRELGRERSRPEWIAAADFQAEYLQIMAELRPDQLDSAELVSVAGRAISSGVVPESVSRLKLVIVDDLQEATRSTLSLLRALADRDVAIIAFGDPDVAANAFRGGEPDVLGRLGSVLGIPGLVTSSLGTVHRQGARLRAFTRAVTDRIGTAGTVGHRHAVPAAHDNSAHDNSAGDNSAGDNSVGENAGDETANDGAGTGILTLEAATPAREWAAIARRLREHHLSGSTSWNEMAVVVRSGGQVPTIARALALVDVPTRTAVGGMPLRDDNAARSLLTVVDVGLGHRALDPTVAAELLLGPFGGLDRLTLRRLRLALRAEELAGGGNRNSDELLVDALGAPGRFATIDHRVARQARELADTLHTVSERASGGTIEELLWLVWERSGLADAWRQHALGAGILAAEANRNLDGILALFTAAKRFVEREPGSPATGFLASVLDAEVPEDTLAPQAAADSVLVTTPSGVVGLEFDIVAVVGLQEGVWPNLRLRGSLLYPGGLVRVVSGLDGVPIDARREVLSDELRMFALAVSRARREVILAAVANDDESASVFLSLAPPDAGTIDAGTLPPLTLRGITGRLRRELVDPDRGNVARTAAAANLALLAEHNVPGANPKDWHGVLGPSTTEPLYLDDEPVPVSPSKLEAYEESPMDWFIESVSGTQSSTAMGIGTIVHWAMETATDPGVDAIWAAIESRWSELLFEAPWLAEQKRRATRILAAGVAEYLGDFERDGKQLLGAEDRFTLELDQAKVNGSIDRVERSPDGSVVIVDLKTGTPITNQSTIDTHPQLGVYQLAYASGMLDEALGELGEHHAGGAKLLYVKSGKDGKQYREGIQHALSDDELEAFRERIRQAAIGMAMASYTGAIDLDRWGSGDMARRALHRVRAVSSD